MGLRTFQAIQYDKDDALKSHEQCSKMDLKIEDGIFHVSYWVCVIELKMQILCTLYSSLKQCILFLSH